MLALAHTLGGQNRYAEAVDGYEALVVLRDVDVNPLHTADVRARWARRTRRRALPEAARAAGRSIFWAGRRRAECDTLHLLARHGSDGRSGAVQLYSRR